MTFSLKTIMFVFAASALLMSLYLAIGLEFLVYITIGLAVFAGVAAHNRGKPIPYWASIGSASLFCITLDHVLRPFNETEAIFSAILLSAGIYLLYFSIRHGYWLTRILGTIVTIPYGIVLWTISENTFRIWPAVVHYWST